MNARIIKETRSLLPVFCVTLLAAIAPRLVWSRETAQAVGMCVFTICCLDHGKASCFGNEYQWRTMPLLLAQPVPRGRIWNEKMLVLGTALGVGLVLYLLCFPAIGQGHLFLPASVSVLRVLHGSSMAWEVSQEHPHGGRFDGGPAVRDLRVNIWPGWSCYSTRFSGLREDGFLQE